MARITFIEWNLKHIPYKYKRVMIHMRPNPYRNPYKWCEELEKVIRWPFQFYHQISETAETDDLVLIFHTGGNGESFDVDNFLQNVNECPPAGMASAELYYDNDEDSDDDDERCPFKFCCQYGVECYKVHTDEENQFFEENGGRSITQEGKTLLEIP